MRYGSLNKEGRQREKTKREDKEVILRRMTLPWWLHCQGRDTGPRLLLVDQAGAADLVGHEIDVYFDAVGDLDEGDAFVDSVVFAVEGHRADNDAVACAFTGDG